MKPTVTPYDRNSRLGLKMVTVNPCNQFIIETLLRWKVKVEKQGLNQFYTYNLAVQSVRKYPLPLLCYEQMKAMEGFGKFFCTAVTKMIRSHYQRARLPTLQQKQQQDKQHELYLRRQMKKLRNTQKKANPNQQQMSQVKEEGDDQQYSQFNDNFASQFPEGDDQQEDQNNDGQSEYSDASQSSKFSKNYKPKPGCQTYYVLKAMNHYLIAHPKEQLVNRGHVNTILFDWKMDKVRTWNKILGQLKEAGYVKIDRKDNYFMSLTTKGKDYISQAEQQETRSNPGNNNITIKIFRKQQLAQNQNIQKLFLLANTRGSFKSDADFISKLTEEERYKVKQMQYELASFIWMLDQKILDYMVLRFKMDNLDVEQFQATMLRVKNSECSNVYVLLQYPLQQNRKLSIPKQSIAELVANTRASGFKVAKFIGSEGSVKLLHTLTDRIIQKIKQVKKGEQILMLGTLDFYNEKNKKMLPVVLKEISRKFLKCIPRISRSSIHGLIEKFPTIKVIHDQMLRLGNNQERIQFLNWLLLKYEPKAGVNMLLVDLLFLDSYEDEPQV